MLRFLLSLIMIFTVAGTFSGCRRNSGEVWEDTKSASRHMNRGVSSLAGKHGDSRAIRCREDFYPYQNECVNGYQVYQEPEYVPLPNYACNEVAMADFVIPQANETPGDPGSRIPGIESFIDPATNPKLAQVFKPIRFGYNSSLVDEPNNIQALQKMAAYLKSHPNTYIFVEGHCDERGAQAFNLALGSRRSNAVRNMLVQDGVDPNQVFTISYGKERPCVLEHHEEAWAANRRAEFKVYQR